MSNASRVNPSEASWRQPSIIVGIATLVVFTFFIVWLITEARADSQAWSKYMDLFPSIEAIVFAAAGAVFGTRLQKQQTNQALDTANRQLERADANAAAAVKGKVLATVVKTVSKPQPEGLESVETALAAAPGLESLADDVLKADVH